MSIVESYKNNGLKYFTPKRAKVWFRSLLRKVTGLRIKESDSIIFSEIITYKSLRCSDCVYAGKCKHCGCSIPELFVAMDVACSGGNFPEFEVKRNWTNIINNLKKAKIKEAVKEFKSKKHWREEWKEFKEENRIYFTTFHG